jgi:hypothetical protein
MEIDGGRVEHVTCAVGIDCGGRGAYTDTPIACDGVQLTTDCKIADPGNTFGAFVFFRGKGSVGAKIAFTRCDFYTDPNSTTDQLIFDSIYDSNACLAMIRCGVMHKTPPLVKDSFWKGGGLLTRDQAIICQQTTNGVGALITL